MIRVAALLRGVNVGGHGKLPMATLRQFLIGLGHVDAVTLLASGNAVFSTDEAPDAVEVRLEAEARARLGLDTAILVRTAADLDQVIAAAPHGVAIRERPSQVHVRFARVATAPALLAALGEAYRGPEKLVAIGRELVIDYPQGAGESALEPALRRLRFPAAATARNWNTVLKLRALL